MYAIGNVIYGVPITEAMSTKLDQWEEGGDPRYDAADELFDTLYSGGSDRIVGYCGVELGNFDECSDFPLSDLTKLKPTNGQMKKVQEKVSKLPEELRKLCLPIDIYIVWSSS